ncbi:MAG: hypothetical protein CVU11_01180 [Bacteroidetes bacterium HGW-Bacteroidetes-6]|jgi:two-component system phosphate regulon sensor histidine kinase PhoR|nr:MAG: hypothetical protein CVU11_01180 [Bacteroidetes bacterium HGW-Bacteroidetes-6]
MKKERRLKGFIIVVSAIALVGIAAIQYYYVRTAIESREATFDRNVNDAMSKVIYQIEKNEIASQVRNKLKSYSRESRLINTLDSLNQELFRSLQQIGIDSMWSDSIIRLNRERISQQVASNQYGEYLKNIDTTKITDKTILAQPDSLIKFELPYSLKKRYEIEKKKDEYINQQERKFDVLYSDVDKFLRRTYIVGDVMEDFFNINHFFPIESRIDSADIDSMVQKELDLRGIETDFVFGIYSPQRDTIIFQNHPGYYQMLSKSKYGYRLFPSDMFSAPDYLVIYFPDRQRYIYSEISGMFMLTLFLVAVIAASFFFILFNLMRQRRLSEMKTDFINNMTHEIKTPISTISLACEMLSDNASALPVEQHENFIRIIAQENKRLAAMTEKILQTAIFERGQLKLKPEKTDIHKLISKAVSNVVLWVNQKNGSIEMKLDAKNHLCEVDPTHFENVIFNLLDNANKYSHNPEIIISTYNSNGYLCVSVKDNGIGIARKELKKIFEKLYRVPTGNIHNVKGFGLGLNYVKAIVDSHSGHVLVESEPGQGTVFTIKIHVLNEK